MTRARDKRGLVRSVSPYWRFGVGLKRFLATPVSIARVRQLVRDRLERREQLFLDVLRDCVFSSRESPYRRLFDHAGCAPGDVDELLRADGLDETLRRLQRAGVYVSAEEFKGREPIRRGSLVFDVDERDFDNPAVHGEIVASTGATRSAGTRTLYDFAHMEKKWAPYQLLRLDVCGMLGAPVGVWLPIMPGAGPVVTLAYAKGGIVPERWFSHVQASGFRPSLKNRLGTAYIVRAARATGTPLPVPEHVSIDEAERVARWMRDTVRAQGRCVLNTYISTAARIGQVAAAKGWDLSGALFTVSSEPFTGAKKRDMRAAGAAANPVYAFMEAGLVGIGCLADGAGDGQHVMSDTTAIISRRRKAPFAGAEVDALQFTTLLNCSPKVLLNTENGDYGRLSEHRCGCPLESMGYGQHLDTIRSFDKLTAEGMSFTGKGLERIVETVLPERFGGDSTCYQASEEEDASGRTRLVVRVHPRLALSDEQAVVGTVLGELNRGADSQRMMAEIWGETGTVCVRREAPVPTARGKLLPVQVG